MIHRRSQPHLTSLAHDDDDLLAASLRHWRNPGQGAQPLVVSPAQRLGRLGEQRSEDNPPDSRQGPQVELAMRLLELAIDQAKPLVENANASQM